METDFNTICEDESTDELGDLLCTMWRQCGEGDFTLVTNALAREFSRHTHETLARSQGDSISSRTHNNFLINFIIGIDGGDECDSDDDEDDAEVAAANDELVTQEIEKQGPVIDEDGFETIGTGRRGRKPR